MIRIRTSLFFLIITISIIIAFSSSGIYGAEIERPIEEADISATTSLDMWHYSGGYWKVGNYGSDKITVAIAK